MYYYIYKITCTAGSFKDHYYIGQHKTDNIDDGYKGSGVKINKYYKKYPNDYIKEILCWCSDEDDMNNKEDLYVGNLYETDPMCLNLCAGGKHNKLSEETKQKISKSHKGKKISDNQKHKISETLKGSIPWMKGKHHTKESKQKMSEAKIGYVPWNKGKKLDDYHRQIISKTHYNAKGKNNPAYGRKWMNNGTTEKYVKSEEVNNYLNNGYSFGKLKK